MIALDTNVLVRYLVRDDIEQAEAARSLLESLTVDRPGYVCREVTVETVWVLERAYGYSRDQIATILEELVATEELIIESADDVGRAASRYRTGGAGFFRPDDPGCRRTSGCPPPIYLRSEGSTA